MNRSYFPTLDQTIAANLPACSARPTAISQRPYFHVSAWHAGPGVRVDDHRAFGPLSPGDEFAGTARALHGLAAPVLLVAMRAASAHRTGCWIHDAAPPLGVGRIRRPPAVQVTFGQQRRHTRKDART